MTIRRLLCSPIIITLSILLGGQSASSESPEELFQLLRIRESSSERMQWRYRSAPIRGVPSYKHGLGPEKDLVIAHQQSLEELATDFEAANGGSVVYDSLRGHYRIERFALAAWDRQEAKAGSRRTVSTFDGDVYARLVSGDAARAPAEGGSTNAQRHTGGQNTRVEISADTAFQDSIDAEFSEAGVHWLPMRVPLLRGSFGLDVDSLPVSRFIDEVRANTEHVSLRVASPTEWILEVPMTQEGTSGATAVYVFNPQQNGAVTSIERSLGSSVPATDGIYVKNTRHATGFWLPVTVIRYYWTGGVGVRTDIFDTELPPQLDDDAFRVDVPPGAEVHDHVNGMFYIAGKTPVEESRAMADYSRQFQLATEEVKEPRSRLSIIGPVILIILLAICFFVVRWRTKTASAILCILATMPQLTGCHDAGEHVVSIGVEAARAAVPGEMKWDEGWLLPVGGKVPMRVSQCGFGATALLLEMMRVPYHPAMVSQEMKPTIGGIRFSDIMRVIADHGVHADARTGVSLADLLDFMQPGLVAVACVPGAGQSGQAHYVVIATDAEGDVVLLDPPRPPVSLRSVGPEEIQRFDNLTVLLCQRRSGELPTVAVRNPEVSIDPDNFAEGAMRGTVVLTNESDRRVPLLSVTRPCSCVEITFSPSMLMPGESLTCDYVVDAGKWGSSSATRAVSFLAPWGEAATVRFSGTAFGGSSGYRRRTLSRFVDIPAAISEAPFKGELNIPLGPEASKIQERFQSQSSVSWCSAEMRLSRGAWYLHVHYEIDDEQLRMISEARTFGVDIGLSLSGESTSIYDVQVAFRRALPCTLEPLEFPGSIGTASIVVDPRELDSGVEWVLDEVFLSGRYAEDVLVAFEEATVQGKWNLHFEATESLVRPVLGKLKFVSDRSPAIYRPFVVTFNQDVN